MTIQAINQQLKNIEFQDSYYLQRFEETKPKNHEKDISSFLISKYN